MDPHRSGNLVAGELVAAFIALAPNLVLCVGPRAPSRVWAWQQAQFLSCCCSVYSGFFLQDAFQKQSASYTHRHAVCEKIWYILDMARGSYKGAYMCRVYKFDFVSLGEGSRFVHYLALCVLWFWLRLPDIITVLLAKNERICAIMALAT